MHIKMRKILFTSLTLIALMIIYAFPALAQETVGDSGIEYLDEVGKVLGNLLVFSIVFEMANSVLFQSRWFLKRYEGKGKKTPIVIIGALVFTFVFKIDFMRDLLTAMKYPGAIPSSPAAGKIVTALLIAGGSSGVLEMFTKLGLRNPVALRQKAEEARKEN